MLGENACRKLFFATSVVKSLFVPLPSSYHIYLVTFHIIYKVTSRSYSTLPKKILNPFAFCFFIYSALLLLPIKKFSD